MKYIKKLTLGLALITTSAMTGCSDNFLETTPSTSISNQVIASSLENLYTALNGIHKEMVSQESGYQCLGGEPGFMMCRDAEADDMTWQTNN